MAVNIVVPEMGESVVDARVGRWLKHAGDIVTVGEPLVELETDKVDVEVTASKSGTLASIAHGDGADVKIGDVLGTIDDAASPESRVQGSAATVGVPESAALVAVLGSRSPGVLGSCARHRGSREGRRPALLTVAHRARVPHDVRKASPLDSPATHWGQE